MTVWSEYTLIETPGITGVLSSDVLETGIPFEIVAMPDGGGGTTPVVLKYRGWASTEYVYWLSNQTTPAGVDPTSIVVVGRV